jgi:hypothetical protein
LSKTEPSLKIFTKVLIASPSSGYQAGEGNWELCARLKQGQKVLCLSDWDILVATSKAILSDAGVLSCKEGQANHVTGSSLRCAARAINVGILLDDL